MAIAKTIQDNLKELGAHPEDLSSGELRYIEQLQAYADLNQAQRSEYIVQYKQSRLTKGSVAKALDISRQTIYNHPVLEKYLDLLIARTKTSDHLLVADAQISDLRDQNREKDAMIQKMATRDAENALLKLRIDALESENSALRRSVLSLKK